MAVGAYKYEVALSFAGEQRGYVEQVARRLTELGISRFYDNDEEATLWGKNLTQHLQTIYFEQSRYFVPFISEEYKNKVWPRLELSFALERNMQQQSPDYQNYILPVYFIKTRVPGLVGSIGYIDGSKISPTALANLIYEKVTGHPPVTCSNEAKETPLASTADCFQTPHTFYVEKLLECYVNMNESHCMVVSGERGVGKRTTVHQFLQGNDHVLYVRPQLTTRYALEPIANALDCSDSVLSANDDLWISDRIKKKIIEYCKKAQKPILYFENMEQYSLRLADFVLDLCKYLFMQSQLEPVCVILEFDNNNGSDIGEFLYQLPAPMTSFFRIPRLSPEQIKICVNNMAGTLSGDEQSISYIYQASCGNLLYLNVIINYLRMKGYLIRQDDQTCICKVIPDGVLADVLRKYILQRYDRLDHTLKEILSKSAVIGQEFDQAILTNPFDVPNADKMLQKIEDLTRLIKEKHTGIYSFETMDSYRLISSVISKEEMLEWHNILAEYYQRKLNNERTVKREIDKKELLSLYLLIAKHNQYASQFRKAISAYLGLIECRLSLADYDGAIDDIQAAKEICEKCESSDLLLKLNQLEARCYFAVGNYAKAVAIFSQCSVSDADRNNWVNNELDTAYCNYMLGDNAHVR